MVLLLLSLGCAEPSGDGDVVWDVDLEDGLARTIEWYRSRTG